MRSILLTVLALLPHSNGVFAEYEERREEEDEEASYAAASEENQEDESKQSVQNNLRRVNLLDYIESVDIIQDKHSNQEKHRPQQRAQPDRKKETEDDVYWNRFMTKIHSMSLPPTPLPSSVPSPLPTSEPTPAPESTFSPTRVPTPEPCGTTIMIDCFSTNSAGQTSPCNKTVIPATACDYCDKRPERYQFKYLGGRCPERDEQEGKYECKDDLTQRPPRNNDYILVGTKLFSSNGFGVQSTPPLGDISYRRFHRKGDTFNIDGENHTDILIYDDDPDSGYARLIQKSTFHTSCSKPLKLKEQLGSMQVTEIECDNGKILSCFANFTWTYTVNNMCSKPGDMHSLRRVWFDTCSGLPESKEISGLLSADQVRGNSMSVAMEMQQNLDLTRPCTFQNEAFLAIDVGTRKFIDTDKYGPFVAGQFFND